MSFAVSDGLVSPWPDQVPDAVRQAFKQSAEDGRPVLVNVTTTWCGPCIRMKRETFPHQAVKAELKHWIVVSIDRDQYRQLAQDIGASGLPTYLVAAADGRILTKQAGYVYALDFAQWLQAARKKHKP